MVVICHRTILLRKTARTVISELTGHRISSYVHVFPTPSPSVNAERERWRRRGDVHKAQAPPHAPVEFWRSELHLVNMVTLVTTSVSASMAALFASPALLTGAGAQLAAYGRGGGGAGGGGGGAGARGGGDGGGGGGDIGDLSETIPGVAGEDYPIYAEVPDTGFTCDGQVEGGKYADPGAECQVISAQSESSI